MVTRCSPENEKISIFANILCLPANVDQARRLYQVGTDAEIKTEYCDSVSQNLMDLNELVSHQKILLCHRRCWNRWGTDCIMVYRWRVDRSRKLHDRQSAN